MTFTGTASDAIFQTFTDFMPTRGSMGMNTGAVAGKGESVPRNESVLKEWKVFHFYRSGKGLSCWSAGCFRTGSRACP